MPCIILNLSPTSSCDVFYTTMEFKGNNLVRTNCPIVFCKYVVLIEPSNILNANSTFLNSMWARESILFFWSVTAVEYLNHINPDRNTYNNLYLLAPYQEGSAEITNDRLKTLN